MLSCHTDKAADFSDLSLKNLHGVVASHSLPEELPWAVFPAPVLTYREETLVSLFLGNKTFIIIQNTLPCRAEPRDQIIKSSVMDHWCSSAAADSHFLVSTPGCSVLPFLPLVHSQTQSSLTIIYTIGTGEAISSGRWVGASSWASVAVDLICLP